MSPTTGKGRRALVVEYLKTEPAPDAKIVTARVAMTSDDRDTILGEIRQAMLAQVKRPRH